MLEYVFENNKNDFTSNGYSYSDIFCALVGGSTHTIWRCQLWTAVELERSDEVYDFLSFWAGKVKDPKEKARISIVLAELL